MANENVGSVLQSLVSNNARVSKQAIAGYQAASHYLVGRVDAGLKTLVDSAPKTRIHGKALRVVGVAGERLTGYYAKAVDRLSSDAQKIVSRVDDRASGAIDKAASQVTKIGNERAARYVGLAGQMSLPPLKLVRDVSAWVATRTEGRTSARVIKRSVAKKARKTVKAVKKAARAA
jgi:hypothetical protein